MKKVSKGISWITVFEISLVQITYAALPEIPTGDFVFFGYSPYLPSFFVALTVLAVFSFGVTTVLFKSGISHQSIFLKILRALYAASVIAIAIKAFVLLVGWSWVDLRSMVFPSASNAEKFFWEFGLAVCSFIGFCLVGRVSTGLLRFIGTLGTCLFLMLCFRIYHSVESTYIPIWNNVVKELPQSSHPRKVVWIIFDEFDPQIAFDQKNIERLPHFKELLNTSVYHSNLYAPAKQTRLSVPSMLMGLEAQSEMISGTANMSLEGPMGKMIPFSYDNSIFYQLKSSGFNSSILGFYLPYCEIFKQLKCTAFPWNYQYSPLSAIEFVYGIRGILRALQAEVTGNTDPMGLITKEQYQNLDRVIDDSSSDLVFLHLNIPHLPGGYSRQVLNEEAIDPYIANLQLTDVFLERILRDINKHSDKKTLLILSSDHWNRSRLGGPYPALFIASIGAQDKNPIELKNPSSGIYIKDLVTQYLSGKITSNQGIANYFKDKSYHDVKELNYDKKSKSIF
jgi:hypothetical protein